MLQIVTLGENNMNVKKKIISIGLAVAMLLTACTSKDTEKNSLNVESNNSKISLDYSASASYTDNYLMYFSDSNIMEYYDIESGYETTVCSKANCKHQGTSSQNSTSTCDGYVDSINNSCLALYDSYIYYVYTPEDTDSSNYSQFFVKKICRAKKDGTGRKDIAELSNAQNINSACYSQGYLALGYNNTFDESGNNLERSQSSASLINLSDGTVISTPVRAGYQGRITQVYYDDGFLIYVYFSLSEEIEFDKWDLESEEYSNYLDSISQIEIIQFNVETSEEKVLWSGNGSCLSLDFGYACISSDKLLIMRLSDQKIYTLDSEYNDCNLSLYDSGVIITDSENSRYLTYDFDSESIKEIGVFDKNCVIDAITENKIFASFPDESSSSGMSIWYIDKADFLNGNFDKFEKTNTSI
jgi:hypothetical protein